MSNELAFPHISTVLIGPDGRMTREGHRFFLRLWERTGAGSGNTDVSTLGGGVGASGTTFWRGDGTWATPAYPVGANPTGSAGLTAVNGSASTFMRSDGAPAISLGIVPTWTGAHTFTAATTMTSLAMSAALTGVTSITMSGALSGATSISTSGGITTGSTTLHTTSVALTNGAAAAAGTLGNAPAAGNPTKWVPINDNGTTRYIPAW
jgi:hypothetical protein